MSCIARFRIVLFLALVIFLAGMSLLDALGIYHWLAYENAVRSAVEGSPSLPEMFCGLGSLILASILFVIIFRSLRNR